MLIDEQEIAAKTAPGLYAALAEPDVLGFERRGAEALCGLFREHGQPGFLVAGDLGGNGARLSDLAHVLRFVGARCPSLAIMMTMHHHTVAGFTRGGIGIGAGKAFLERVARERALVASAFAEGRPGSDVLDSTVRCARLDGGAQFAVTGAKKPCSMAHFADYALVGVALELEDDAHSRGMALVDTKLEGVRGGRFWPAEILASADSNVLILDGVTVGADCVLGPRDASRAAMRERFAVAHAEIALSCLFQVLVSATYLGMASRLCELVLQRRGGTPAQRLDILAPLETAAMAVYRLAETLEERDFSPQLLAHCVLVSHDTAARVERVVDECVKALGGSGFLGSPEVQYLVLASRCLAFHPPSNAAKHEIVDGCYTDMV